MKIIIQRRELALSLCFIDYNKWRRKAQLVEIYKKLLNFLLKQALESALVNKTKKLKQLLIPPHHRVQWIMIDWHSHDLRKQIPALLCNRLTYKSQGQNGQNVVKMAKWQDQQHDIGRLPRHMCVNFRYQ